MDCAQQVSSREQSLFAVSTGTLRQRSRDPSSLLLDAMKTLALIAPP
jgi:hypothetical protein